MTGADLPANVVDRLVKLCGMLGSAHDGERAAAGLKADQLLRENGLRWGDVIGAPQGRPEQPPFGSRSDPDAIDQDAAAWCLQFPQALTEWEIDFCRNVARWSGRLTPRQRDVLERLLIKCREHEMGAD